MAFSIPIIGPIVEGLTKLGSTYLEGRNVKIKAKSEAEATVMVNASKSIQDWEALQAQNASTSWKDEWLTLLFSIPLILAFTPGADHLVREGFLVLADTPDWYTYTISVIVAASFGVRSVIGFKNAGNKGTTKK